MRVVDIERWTTTKKRIAGTLILAGIFMGFGIESSMWWALPAFVLAYAGAIIIKDCY